MKAVKFVSVKLPLQNSLLLHFSYIFCNFANPQTSSSFQARQNLPSLRSHVRLRLSTKLYLHRNFIWRTRSPTPYSSFPPAGFPKFSLLLLRKCFRLKCLSRYLVVRFSFRFFMIRVVCETFSIFESLFSRRYQFQRNFL